MSSSNKSQDRPLILDIGSNSFRMGWAGDDFPDIIAPSVYVDLSDFLFTSDVLEGLEEIYLQNIEQEYLVGHAALKYQHILKLHEFKKENNYNLLLKFFYYYYQQLGIEEKFLFKQPLIILTSFNMSNLEKEKYKEIFLESFGFPALLFLSDNKAILSTVQKTSGVVINIGESKTLISTIFHGFTNIMAKDVFPISSKDLTNYMLNMLISKKMFEENLYVDEMIAKEIKERYSLCTLHPEDEIKKVKEGLTKYDRMITLPNSLKVKINVERLKVSEPLFDPKIIHIDYMSLAEAVSKVIKAWDRENWEELIPNIILTGGGSLIKGLDERLKIELMSFFSEKIRNKINVIAPSGRENMGWIGASILYSKGQLNNGWIENPRKEQEIATEAEEAKEE